MEDKIPIPVIDSIDIRKAITPCYYSYIKNGKKFIYDILDKIIYSATPNKTLRSLCLYRTAMIETKSSYAYTILQNPKDVEIVDKELLESVKDEYILFEKNKIEDVGSNICPYCGKEMVGSIKGEASDGGYLPDPSGFNLYCNNHNCYINRNIINRRRWSYYDLNAHITVIDDRGIGYTSKIGFSLDNYYAEQKYVYEYGFRYGSIDSSDLTMLHRGGNGIIRDDRFEFEFAYSINKSIRSSGSTVDGDYKEEIIYEPIEEHRVFYKNILFGTFRKVLSSCVLQNPYTQFSKEEYDSFFIILKELGFEYKEKFTKFAKDYMDYELSKNEDEKEKLIDTLVEFHRRIMLPIEYLSWLICINAFSYDMYFVADSKHSLSSYLINGNMINSSKGDYEFLPNIESDLDIELKALLKEKDDKNNEYKEASSILDTINNGTYIYITDTSRDESEIEDSIENIEELISQEVDEKEILKLKMKLIDEKINLGLVRSKKYSLELENISVINAYAPYDEEISRLDKLIEDNAENEEYVQQLEKQKDLYTEFFKNTNEVEIIYKNASLRVIPNDLQNRIYELNDLIQDAIDRLDSEDEFKFRKELQEVTEKLQLSVYEQIQKKKIDITSLKNENDSNLYGTYVSEGFIDERKKVYVSYYENEIYTIEKELQDIEKNIDSKKYEEYDEEETVKSVISDGIAKGNLLYEQLFFIIFSRKDGVHFAIYSFLEREFIKEGELFNLLKEIFENDLLNEKIKYLYTSKPSRGEYSGIHLLHIVTENKFITISYVNDIKIIQEITPDVLGLISFRESDYNKKENVIGFIDEEGSIASLNTSSFIYTTSEGNLSQDDEESELTFHYKALSTFSTDLEKEILKDFSLKNKPFTHSMVETEAVRREKNTKNKLVFAQRMNDRNIGHEEQKGHQIFYLEQEKNPVPPEWANDEKEYEYKPSQSFIDYLEKYGGVGPDLDHIYIEPEYPSLSVTTDPGFDEVTDEFLFTGGARGIKILPSLDYLDKNNERKLDFMIMTYDDQIVQVSRFRYKEDGSKELKVFLTLRYAPVDGEGNYISKIHNIIYSDDRDDRLIFLFFEDQKIVRYKLFLFVPIVVQTSRLEVLYSMKKSAESEKEKAEKELEEVNKLLSIEITTDLLLKKEELENKITMLNDHIELYTLGITDVKVYGEKITDCLFLPNYMLDRAMYVTNKGKRVDIADLDVLGMSKVSLAHLPVNKMISGNSYPIMLNKASIIPNNLYYSFEDKKETISTSIWSKIYHRQLLFENNLKRLSERT